MFKGLWKVECPNHLSVETGSHLSSVMANQGLCEPLHWNVQMNCVGRKKNQCQCFIPDSSHCERQTVHACVARTETYFIMGPPSIHTLTATFSCFVSFYRITTPITLFNYYLNNFTVSYFAVKSFSRCGYRIIAFALVLREQKHIKLTPLRYRTNFLACFNWIVFSLA